MKDTDRYSETPTIPIAAKPITISPVLYLSIYKRFFAMDNIEGLGEKQLTCASLHLNLDVLVSSRCGL